MPSSLSIFRQFLVRREDGSVDASRIISLECYQTWLANQRKQDCEKISKVFQRILSNHVCGVDGRLPFECAEEEAILLVLRRKLRWPCFPAHLNIGRNGFRSRGFHERTRAALEEEQATNPHPARTAPITTTTTPFEDGINKLISSFPSFNLDAWQAVMAFARFTVLSSIPLARYKAYPHADYPRELCTKVSLANPGCFVAVSDLGAKECKDIVLAQNEESVRLSGVMTGGLCNQVPFHVVDLVKVAMATGGAFNSPGERLHMPAVRINCLGGVQRAFDLCLYVDEQTYLVIVYGKGTSS